MAVGKKFVTPLAAAALLAPALVGCAADEAAVPEPVKSTVVVWVTPTETAASAANETEQPSQDQQSQPRPAETKPADASQDQPAQPPAQPPRNLPARAYSGAGGPVPANAMPAQVVHTHAYGDGRTASIQTPTKNIQCDILVYKASNGATGRTMGCSVHSFKELKPFGEVSGLGVNTWVDPSRGKVSPKSDAPDYIMGAQTVEYGQLVHFEGFVCASAFDGLTCWDSVTGRGAVMYREYADFF